MFKPVVRGNVSLDVIEARSLDDTDNFIPFLKDLSDPWVQVFVGDFSVLSTSRKVNTLNPVWKASAVFPLCHDRDYLDLKVWDEDVLSNKLIGEAKVSLKPVDKFWNRDEWVDLKNGKGQVHLKIKFTPFKYSEDNINLEPLNTKLLYFPSRTGVLTLYQDAHAEKILNTTIGEIREPANNLFEDVAESFENARKFIYISGWSLWSKLKLKRLKSSETIGELLKRKADDGVSVLIMLWSEKSSSKLCKELFGTHHTETVNFFQGTKVKAISVQRESNFMSKFAEGIVGLIFSHHMKLVAMDSPAKGFLAFTGGIDLTDGRFDTPEHSLWESLSSYHVNDFYNGFVPSLTVEFGPREPWHDVHAKIEGLCALDLIRVFEDRWKKQVPEYTDLLLPLTDSSNSELSFQTKTDLWNLQVLQAIDSHSAFLDSNPGSLSDMIHCKKDCGMQLGTVQLVRSCRKFIYIESQYFIGSAQAWLSKNETCAWNVLPLEIAEQICSGILNKQPVRAYIVIPLMPEGDAASSVGSFYMSDILHWQFLTIQMMYKKISECLKEVGSSEHPEDYLLFLCLVKKIERTKSQKQFPKIADEGTEAHKWQTKSKFPIYVHSKMILTDDARIIVGSANLNERSLDGSRDTEVGIAASQTSDVNGKPNLVTNGSIAQFRKNLWDEHTGGLSSSLSELRDPSTLECISTFKKFSYDTLLEYTDDNVDKDIHFRFMKYPLKIEKDGSVGGYSNLEKIPDFDLPVVGSRSLLPPVITT